ncbi:MAG: hypothetical protein ACOCT7_01430 [Candidatus Saliniplasma sp.]
MPRGDGTGPPDSGGRGQGRGQGRGAGSAGPGGNCVCPSCGKKVPHKRGVPCYEMKCPECGSQMIRER